MMIREFPKFLIKSNANIFNLVNVHGYGHHISKTELYLLLQTDIYKGLHELIIASLNDLDKYYDQQLSIQKPAARIII